MIIKNNLKTKGVKLRVDTDHDNGAIYLSKKLKCLYYMNDTSTVVTAVNVEFEQTDYQDFDVISFTEQLLTILSSIKDNEISCELTETELILNNISIKFNKTTRFNVENVIKPIQEEDKIKITVGVNELKQLLNNTTKDDCVVFQFNKNNLHPVGGTKSHSFDKTTITYATAIEYSVCESKLFDYGEYTNKYAGVVMPMKLKLGAKFLSDNK